MSHASPTPPEKSDIVQEYLDSLRRSNPSERLQRAIKEIEAEMLPTKKIPTGFRSRERCED